MLDGVQRGDEMVDLRILRNNAHFCGGLLPVDFLAVCLPFPFGALDGPAPVPPLPFPTESLPPPPWPDCNVFAIADRYVVSICRVL